MADERERDDESRPDPKEVMREAGAEDLPTGIAEPPGPAGGEDRRGQEPHHALNNPVTDPDPAEWPDPYEKRDDPRDGPAPFIEDTDAPEPTYPAKDAPSTSEPHPDQDPERERGKHRRPRTP